VWCLKAQLKKQRSYTHRVELITNKLLVRAFVEDVSLLAAVNGLLRVPLSCRMGISEGWLSHHQAQVFYWVLL